MIRRRYPTPKEIRRAQLAWLPLLIPLLLLGWMTFQDARLNVQKRRLDYEFNELTEKQKAVTRRIESATAALATKKGYWTSVEFARTIGLQPPQPGHIITVPPLSPDLPLWELPLEPVQNHSAFLPAVSGYSPAIPAPADTVAPSRKQDIAAQTADASNTKKKPAPPAQSKNKTSTVTKRPDKSPETTARKQQDMNRTRQNRQGGSAASPGEDPASWLAPL
ncbi:MAG TPA: hypothetical protein PLO53_01780 [Candidatus Hydrogenedentes bacterium]|nr:hypothetical protein [Candidatus Hydrogenedentota bacterium]